MRLLLWPLILAICFQSVWAVGDAEANAAETSTQCPESGAYTAETQAEVDAFAENYPECEELTSLKIAPDPIWQFFGYDPPDPLVSLAAFERIRGVGNLQIYDTDLVSLGELQSLSEVDRLDIGDNQYLTNIGLSNTLLVKQEIRISINPALESLGSFVELSDTSRFNRIDINGNSSLQDCTSLASFLGYPDRAPYEVLRLGWTIQENSSGCMNATEIVTSSSLPREYQAEFTEPVRCPEDEYGTSSFNLVSQSDVDSFVENYGTCNSVHVLTIVGSDITNLDGLASLIHADNSIMIDAPNIVDISGLKNLIAVEKIFLDGWRMTQAGDAAFVERVADPAFESLLIYGFSYSYGVGGGSGSSWSTAPNYDVALFPNLKYALGPISVGPASTVQGSKIKEFCKIGIYNTDLTDLSFLAGAAMPCNEGFRIFFPVGIALSGNDALTDTSALQSVQVSGNGLSLIVRNNERLTALYAPTVPTGYLAELVVSGENIAEFLHFEGFTAAGKIDLDRNLDYPTGSILPNVRRADSLGVVMESGSSIAIWFPALEKLGNLSLANADFSANWLPALKELGGLRLDNATFVPAVEELGSLVLSNASFSGTLPLRKVGHLELYRPIGNLSGLRGVKTIETLWITDLLLENLDFLESIETIGQIQLANNSRLRDLSTLSAVGFTLNSSVGTPTWCSGLTLLCVVGNDRLEDLPLANWYKIARDDLRYRGIDSLDVGTEIRSNASLKKLQVFHKASHVSELEITDNDSLENLNDLTNLNQGMSLKITDNDALSDCRGLAPLLGWPSGPSNVYKLYVGEGAIEGAIELSGNASGCNDSQSILDAVVGPTQPTVNSISRQEDEAIVFSFTESVARDDLFPLENHKLSCDGASIELSDSTEATIFPADPYTDIEIVVSGLGTFKSAAEIEVRLDLLNDRDVGGYVEYQYLIIDLISPEGVQLPLWDIRLHSRYRSTELLTPLSEVPDDLLLDGVWKLRFQPTINNYFTSWILTDLNLNIREHVQVTTESESVETSALVEGRDYVCKISPITKLGAIPASDPVSVSLASIASSAPSAPTIRSFDVKNSAIVLHVIAGEGGGGNITRFDASCTDGTDTFTGTSTSSPITVSGLTNGVSYTCTVTTTNSVGTSAASASTASIIPSPEPPRVVLEEPVMDETHTGVGNLRGWAISSDGIEKVEVHIDGAYAFDAPYGGVRTDVRDAFPDVEGSEDSGFSLAFNYSNLSAGVHTISAVAQSGAGATKESAADFEVVRFDSSFISDPNAVDLSLGSCSLASDEVTLSNVTVDGSQHDLVMKWRRAEQGFELIQIDKSDDETAEPAPVALGAQQSGVVAQSDPVLRVVLEEPVSEEIHTGVGNLRGWAVADEGIEKVEIYIDGAYSFDAPYGGVRTDVRDAFPDVEGSEDSGFSLAFNYSNLSAGGHTIKAIAYDRLGFTKESSAEFTVVRFDSSFISALNAVDLSEGSCSLGTDEVSLTDVTVDGSLHDLVMKWRTAEQGFEIVEIR